MKKATLDKNDPYGYIAAKRKYGSLPDLCDYDAEFSSDEFVTFNAGGLGNGRVIYETPEESLTVTSPVSPSCKADSAQAEAAPEPAETGSQQKTEGADDRESAVSRSERRALRKAERLARKERAVKAKQRKREDRFYRRQSKYIKKASHSLGGFEYCPVFAPYKAPAMPLDDDIAHDRFFRLAFDIYASAVSERDSEVHREMPLKYAENLFAALKNSGAILKRFHNWTLCSRYRTDLGYPVYLIELMDEANRHLWETIRCYLPNGVCDDATCAEVATVLLRYHYDGFDRYNEFLKKNMLIVQAVRNNPKAMAKIKEYYFPRQKTYNGKQEESNKAKHHQKKEGATA